MEKIGLIISGIIALIGLYFIDKNILLSFELNHNKWFGKYVFFAAFNILVFWTIWVVYKKVKKPFNIIFSTIFSLIILSIGIAIA